ncbi:hypothetical protein [Streptomyces sp. DSM 41534]
MNAPDVPIPPAVTFQSGAKLLIDLGIVDHITHQGIRHIAKTNPRWPFGPGRPQPYWELANATVMDTDPFLDFFREVYVRPGGAS